MANPVQTTRQASAGVEAVIILYVPVRSVPLTARVAAGPLPLVWERGERTIRSGKRERLAYVAPNLEHALHGRTQDARRYLELDAEIVRDGQSATACAVEWLALRRRKHSRLPVTGALAMVHLTAHAPDWESLRRLVAGLVDLNPIYRSAARAEMTGIVGDLRPDVRRAFCLVGAMWAEGHCSDAEREIRSLAELGRHPTPDLRGGNAVIAVAPSRDTYMAINRFGVFHVWYRSGEAPTQEERDGFFFRVRSGYADCVLLAQGQREILTQVEAGFDVSLQERPTLGELRGAAEDLADFERVWWATEYEDQGPFTLMLQACQLKFNLGERLASLRARIEQAGAIRTASGVEILTVVNMVVALLSVVVAVVVSAWAAEPEGVRGGVIGLALRLGAVSLVVLVLGSFVGWVGLRRWNR